jgi:glycosyltransferase involved in cell wall biosynthesis
MKKRIAFISEHASPLAVLGGVDSGGQNVYVAELAKALAKNGYEIDIYTRKDDKQLAEITEWLPGIRVIHVKAGPCCFVEKEKLLSFMHEFADNMLDIIKRHMLYYQLVHANFFMSGLVASIIKKVLHIPYVITFHALGLVRKAYQKEKDCFPEERCDIEKYIIGDASMIIAECPQDKEDLISYYGADPYKIRIAPCGFSPEEFYPIDKKFARAKLKLNPDETILLQLGRLVPRKGIDNVIHATARLRKRKPPFRLVIVGGETNDPDPVFNPEIGRLQKIAKEENILDKVTFTGRQCRSELKYFYAAADVFITTPWYEPFGITPLEAMACGTPVIGANVGGIKYSVQHGRTGLLVAPQNPEALAKKIETLVSDEKLLLRCGLNAIRRVNDHFTWSSVARLVSRIYEQATSIEDSRAGLYEFVWLKENFSLRTIRNLLPESFYRVLNVQYEKGYFPG